MGLVFMGLPVGIWVASGDPWCKSRTSNAKNDLVNVCGCYVCSRTAVIATQGRRDHLPATAWFILVSLLFDPYIIPTYYTIPISSLYDPFILYNPYISPTYYIIPI